MTKKTNPRKDFSQTAFDIFQQAIGEVEAPEKVLDNLSDAASGRKLRHKTFLPIICPDKENK